MDRFASFIVHHRKAIIALFVVATLVCAPLTLFVKVNYNIVDYLPESSQSTTALKIMDEEFEDAIFNLQVMVHDVSLPEALEYKAQFAQVEGVTMVNWLDDVVDLKQPLAIADADLVKTYYKDGTALFELAVKKGAEQEAIAKLQDIVGPSNAVGGESSSLAAVQTAAVNEVLGAFAILVPAIIILLALSTSSWIEPLILLISIGIAIILNMGTNLAFGEVSFITNSVSPILQMAVSLDYAIFLLHSFADYRKEHEDPVVAMKHAIRTSFSTIASSGATTLAGFMALMFMQFLIGADLGTSLAKGIIFSFITSIVFLPAFTLGIYKLIDRTQHRPLLPSFENIHRVLFKLAIPVIAVVILALVPSYLGQSRTDFLYGAESGGGGSRAQFDTEKIEAEFGETNPIVMLVPRGDVAREQLLTRQLEGLSHVTSVVSYVKVVGATIPSDILDPSLVKRFYSEDYARFVIYTDVPAEGEVSFATMGDIREAGYELYGDEAYSLGRSMNLYDMKSVVQQDNLRVNLAAILAIFLVLLLTFRSLVLPFVLLLTIESAIWINLALPYFLDTSINYIGYLVLSTVQLGATVDYAILLTNTYLRLRKALPKREAIRRALGSSFKSILVSASVLSIAGFALLNTSSNPIVCDIGAMLGRGTLLSFTLVVCFLPALLLLLDPLIGKLTWRAGFLKPLHPKENSHEH
ncbi:MAG: MMPL family transporter [Coriobacteriales bacterium]|jgi:predicted RND superfamily exporter protein|nr:MMPL family transporter [Coriobacteriales bacterium]